MSLRSKEPPEHPLAPTDLSHRNLICIFHRTSICHPCFQHVAICHSFPSHFVSRLPSRHLDTRLIPSKWLHTQITQNPPSCLLGQCETVAPANLAVPHILHTIPRYDRARICRRIHTKIPTPSHTRSDRLPMRRASPNN